MAKQDGLVANEGLLIVVQLLRLEMDSFLNRMSTIIHLIEHQNKVFSLLIVLADHVLIHGTEFVPGTDFVPKHEKFEYEYGRQKQVQIRDQAGNKYNSAFKKPNKGGEERWNCYRRTSKGCKVVVKTLEGFIISQKNEHTCL